VRVALLKLAGIESAEVSLTTATADVRLKPDNRITMAQLREVLRKNGYPTRDAQIEARGKIVERGGWRVLDLLNGSAMDLADNPAAAHLPLNQIVEVAAMSRADGKTPEKLTVKNAGSR
jgi:hypothetical protein